MANNLPNKLYFLLKDIKKISILIDKRLSDLDLVKLPHKSNGVDYRKYNRLTDRNLNYIHEIIYFEHRFKDIHYNDKKTRCPRLDKKQYKAYYSLMKQKTIPSSELVNFIFIHQKQSTKLIIYLHKYIWDQNEKNAHTADKVSAMILMEQTLNYQNLMYLFLTEYYPQFKNHCPCFKKTPLPEYKK